MTQDDKKRFEKARDEWLVHRNSLCSMDDTYAQKSDSHIVVVPKSKLDKAVEAIKPFVVHKEYYISKMQMEKLEQTLKELGELDED